jgi:hypothetical protein
MKPDDEQIWLRHKVIRMRTYAMPKNPALRLASGSLALGRQAISELAIGRRCRAPNGRGREHRTFGKMDDRPAAADVMLAQEIHQYVRGQKSPIDVAIKSISEPRMQARY